MAARCASSPYSGSPIAIRSTIAKAWSIFLRWIRTSAETYRARASLGALNRTFWHSSHASSNRLASSNFRAFRELALAVSGRPVEPDGCELDGCELDGCELDGCAGFWAPGRSCAGGVGEGLQPRDESRKNPKRIRSLFELDFMMRTPSMGSMCIERCEFLSDHP